jgi:hypothetical protein
MIWVFNLRGWSDHLTTSTIPTTYTTAGHINGQSPNQRWTTEEAIMKNVIAASVPDHMFHKIKSKTSTVTDLQRPPLTQANREKIDALKRHAQKIARDLRSHDDVQISYLETLEERDNDNLRLAQMLAR